MTLDFLFLSVLFSLEDVLDLLALVLDLPSVDWEIQLLDLFRWASEEHKYKCFLCFSLKKIHANKPLANASTLPCLAKVLGKE